MSTFDVRPTNVPQTLGDHQRRIQTLEAVVPGAQGDLRQTGWTAVFGDAETPVPTGAELVTWKVPRQIVGDGTFNWYIYQPSAAVVSPPSGEDVEIWLYRLRTDGTTILTVTSLLDTALIIDDGTLDSNVSSQPVTVAQYANLLDTEAGSGNYDSILVAIDTAGGAEGLSINVPIGIEQPAGSGYHIP